MANNLEIIVGEFFPKPATGSRAFVSVYATQPEQGEMQVWGEDGQLHRTAPFHLDKEGDALELDISGLPPGRYRVRISMHGEQWERELWMGL